MDVRDVMAAANDAAALALRAWMLAAGLAIEIDAVRFPDGFSPVPAPGLEAFVAAAECAADDATLAADRARALSADPDAAEAVATSLVAAGEGRRAAELACRDLAQLAFGVSACLIGDDRSQRLDRAAVAVLHPPGGHAGRLEDDALTFRAKTRPELVVEVGGVLCRVLVDRNTRVTLRGGSRTAVDVSVDWGDTLRASTHDSAVDPGDGWISDTAGATAAWPSPVVIREAAEAVVRVLLGDPNVEPIDVTGHVDAVE